MCICVGIHFCIVRTVDFNTVRQRSIEAVIVLVLMVRVFVCLSVCVHGGLSAVAEKLLSRNWWGMVGMCHGLSQD